MPIPTGSMAALLLPPLVASPMATSALEGYASTEALLERVAAISADGAVERELLEIGRTGEGRPIMALRLGPAGAPALLLVAGLDGGHAVGPQTAVRVAERLASTQEELLASRAVWIVPAVNVDGLTHTLTRPGSPVRRIRRPIDDDRDGRVDEDPPEDLDGNGMITMMRVRDPAPPFVADLVADPDEPRLLRSPDPLKGERPSYRLYVEGVDSDGDGLINEDGLEGVDADRNFLHRWPEFGEGAGPYPLSEPETFALATFVLAHPEIAASLTYGRHDNLARASEAKGMDVNPQIPVTIAPADAPLYAEWTRIFKEATGQSRAPTEDAAGAFFAWMYAHRGVPSFTTVVWGRPDAGEPAGAADGDGQESSAAATPPAPEAAPTPPSDAAPPRRGRGGRRGAPGGAAPAPARGGAAPGDLAEDREWLKHAEGAGRGFVPWTAFDHPTLGPVEIGGFEPLFRLNPPADELDALAEAQSAFVVELLRRLPVWTIEGPTVETLSEGLHRVRVTVRNDGTLPTHTAYARQSSIGLPLVVRLEGPIDATLAGRQVERIRGLDGGAARHVDWLVRAPDADNIAVIVRRPGAAEERLTAGAANAPATRGATP